MSKERHNVCDPIVHRSPSRRWIRNDPDDDQDYYDPANDLRCQAVRLPAQVKGALLGRCLPDRSDCSGCSRASAQNRVSASLSSWGAHWPLLRSGADATNCPHGHQGLLPKSASNPLHGTPHPAAMSRCFEDDDLDVVTMRPIMGAVPRSSPNVSSQPNPSLVIEPGSHHSLVGARRVGLWP